MMTATGGYYNGDKIIMDEEIALKTGQRVIITVLDSTKDDVRPTAEDIKRFRGVGGKMPYGDAQEYIRELRDNDRF